MSGVVHLAGPMIAIGTYAVQRCVLCGVVLEEFNVRHLASLDGSPLSALAIGGFYEVDSNRISFVSEAESTRFASDLEVPDNCCVRMRKKGGGA